ncbi:ROK family protein [Halopseudomonas nanhaiensis]|uniref:ROK family protein n=1 Tax=Halopseudomonas nanhaiensis TaxID=2830842 RepID=UPI001CBCEE54|nr:ROK family protein [Halopseudomonas nanhaiensis]UAW97389.1 ROK family protein [Halopseudomonas nanhaiensis]
MSPGILAIDIGGTSIKAAVLDERGTPLCERVRVPTPRPCPPDRLLELVGHLVQPLPAYDRIAVGFPGAVRDGRVLTAANLGNAPWVDYPLEEAIARQLRKPTQLLNDADMQGFALIEGTGLELVITLGTGFGTAWFRHGELMPHLEIAHHPIRSNLTYDQYLGDEALKRVGRTRWNARLDYALDILQRILRPDSIILAGGNARLVDLDLPESVVIKPDAAGISGGAALWRSTQPG